MSVDSLTVADLIKLGGLKERCSAPLRCEKHGLAVPCDLCDVEGTAGVVCNACGHYFAEGVTRESDRPCQSVAEFSRTGKIAFEDVAIKAIEVRKLEQTSEKIVRHQIDDPTPFELVPLERKPAKPILAPASLTRLSPRPEWIWIFTFCVCMISGLYGIEYLTQKFGGLSGLVAVGMEFLDKSRLGSSNSDNKPQVAVMRQELEQKSVGVSSTTRSSPPNQERCGGDGECSIGLFCIQRKCQALLTIGSKCNLSAECAGATSQCVAGRCAIQGQQPQVAAEGQRREQRPVDVSSTTRSSPPNQERCGGDGECSTGLYCIRGRCQTQVTIGSKCDRSTECAGATSQCVAGRCAIQGQQPQVAAEGQRRGQRPADVSSTTRSSPPNQERCGGDGECSTGLYCIRGRCQTQVTIGSKCDRSTECAGTTSQCVAGLCNDAKQTQSLKKFQTFTVYDDHNNLVETKTVEVDGAPGTHSALKLPASAKGRDITVKETLLSPSGDVVKERRYLVR